MMKIIKPDRKYAKTSQDPHLDLATVCEKYSVQTLRRRILIPGREWRQEEMKLKEKNTLSVLEDNHYDLILMV